MMLPDNKPSPDPMLTNFIQQWVKYSIIWKEFVLYRLRHKGTPRALVCFFVIWLAKQSGTWHVPVARNFERQIFTYVHNDVIKWKHFPRYWPFVRGIHRSPMNSPNKSQWRGALMFFICAWINGFNNKQSRRRWFETPSPPLCRHCNDYLN